LEVILRAVCHVRGNTTTNGTIGGVLATLNITTSEQLVNFLAEGTFSYADVPRQDFVAWFWGYSADYSGPVQDVQLIPDLDGLQNRIGSVFQFFGTSNLSAVTNITAYNYTLFKTAVGTAGAAALQRNGVDNWDKFTHFYSRGVAVRRRNTDNWLQNIYYSNQWLQASPAVCSKCATGYAYNYTTGGCAATRLCDSNCLYCLATTVNTTANATSTTSSSTAKCVFCKDGYVLADTGSVCVALQTRCLTGEFVVQRNQTAPCAACSDTTRGGVSNCFSCDYDKNLLSATGKVALKC